MEAGVDDLVGDELEVVGDPHPGGDELADVLVGHHVPNAVARQHQELVLLHQALLQVKLCSGQEEMVGVSAFVRLAGCENHFQGKSKLHVNIHISTNN